MNSFFRNANLNVIQQSCVNNGWGQNNDATEMQAIHDSIVAEASSSGIPAEFILAIMVQESKGCVRAPTTSWGFPNPGLMQSAGTSTCNPGTPMYPCPAATIRAMIHEGTAGQGRRTTLANSLAYFTGIGVKDDSKWYKTARMYNAGSGMNPNNLGIGPTPCYASDIANRLIQPFGDSTCVNSIIGTLTRASGSINVGNQNTPTPGNQNTPTSSSQNTPSTSVKSTPTPSKASIPQPAKTTPCTTSTPKPTSSSVSQPKQTTSPSTTSSGGCSKYYTPKSGDTCMSSGIDFATFRQLNPTINAWCTNLWVGVQYCIAR